MINTNILTSTQLTWQALQPDITHYQYIFSNISHEDSDSLSKVQPRLLNALAHLHHQTYGFPLLLLRSQENKDYLAWIATAAQRFQPEKIALFGGDYCHTMGEVITLLPPIDANRPFTSKGGVHYADWIEPEQLLGCVRQYKDRIQPEPGLIHRANGGTLILSVNILLEQPLLWLRLRKCIEQGRFDWYSQDERQPLPVSIPPLPLQLRLVLCGDRDALANFQDLDSEVYKIAHYSEFEENMQVLKKDDITAWCQWTLAQAKLARLPKPSADFWPQLINEAVRMTGDQEMLPLCPRWLCRQLQETALHGNALNAKAFKEALGARLWRESSLADCRRNEILFNQIMIETEGEVVGQINGLSVVEFPGHPRPWGEPLRITCVVHPGDGEFTDVERKAELGGNIHAKGMMIMQAYLISELELEQQIPFSASLVFEQSYSEVDGDSASLAELCVLISALANQPLTQQIAVTGSVDQFGNVQLVGCPNEKIESFFHICNARGLTGKQGVILPANNVRNLSLSKEVVDTVKNGHFHIWAIENVDEALPLLTGIFWKNEHGESLLRIIQKRITQLNEQEKRQYQWWPSRWLKWFKHS